MSSIVGMQILRFRKQGVSPRRVNRDGRLDEKATEESYAMNPSYARGDLGRETTVRLCSGPMNLETLLETPGNIRRAQGLGTHPPPEKGRFLAWK